MDHESFKEYKRCLNCDTEKIMKGKIIVANLPTDDLQIFKDVLYDVISNDNKNCDNCGQCTMNCTYILGSHIFIELSAPYSEKSKENRNFDISITLASIPQRLTLNEILFTFREAINFIPPHSTRNDAIGHYISYCWREHTNTWERYDDLQCASRSETKYKTFQLSIPNLHNIKS